MKFLIAIFFILFADAVLGQQVINKLDVKDLKLPNESASRAAIIDGSNKVKSSATISTTELEALDNVSSNIQTQLNGKQATLGFTPEDVANKSTNTSLGASDTLYPTQNAVKTYADTLDAQSVKLTGNQSVAGTKTLTGKLVASSTTSAFLPCPVMTVTQRNALSPVAGDCVFNTTSSQVEFYSGSAWASAVVSVNYLTVSGMTNPKRCWIAFGGAGTLTSPTVCTSSPCTIYASSPSGECGTVSVTRTSAGVYNCIWPNGSFANDQVAFYGGVTVNQTRIADSVAGTGASGNAQSQLLAETNTGTDTDSYGHCWVDAPAP